MSQQVRTTKFARIDSVGPPSIVKQVISIESHRFNSPFCHFRSTPISTSMQVGCIMINDRMMVKSDGRILVVRQDEIDWLEADGNYVRLHVRNESHLIR